MQTLEFGNHGLHVGAARRDLDHRHHARRGEIDAQPLGPGPQPGRDLLAAQETVHQGFPEAGIARQELHQACLLQHGLGGEPDQFGKARHLIRLAGKADAADDGVLAAQRQVDARLDAVEASRHLAIDLHRVLLVEHQQGALVHGADTTAVAAGDDDAAGVHHVDVAIDDLHRPIDDRLGERRIHVQQGVGLRRAIQESLSHEAGIILRPTRICWMTDPPALTDRNHRPSAWRRRCAP